MIKLVLEDINEYNNLDILYTILSKLYPYSLFDNNMMFFSNKLKRDGTIDIWNDDNNLYSLKIKIINNTIVIIALLNQGGPLGISTRSIDILHNFAINNNYTILIENDESYGYWERIIKKYNDNIITIK